MKIQQKSHLSGSFYKKNTPAAIRTRDPLLRRQMLYPAELQAQKMERVMGIEPTRPAWKAGILTIELHPLIFRATFDIIYNNP